MTTCYRKLDGLINGSCSVLTCNGITIWNEEKGTISFVHLLSNVFCFREAMANIAGEQPVFVALMYQMCERQK